MRTADGQVEVLTGLKESDQIITGSYKAIRTVRNEAKIKVNNEIKTTTTTAQ